MRQLFRIDQICLSVRCGQQFRNSIRHCKLGQNRNWYVSLKSGQIVILSAANMKNIFSGKDTFSRVYAIRAPIFVQRRKQYILKTQFCIYGSCCIPSQKERDFQIAIKEVGQQVYCRCAIKFILTNLIRLLFVKTSI